MSRQVRTNSESQVQQQIERVCRCQPGRRGSKAKPIWTTEEVEEEVSEKSLRNGASHGFLVPAKALPGTPGALGLKRIQKRSRAEANGGILIRSRKAKRKFRLNAAKMPTRCHSVVLIALVGMFWALPYSLKAQEVTANPPNLNSILDALKKTEAQNPALSQSYEVIRQYEVFRGDDPKPYSEVTAHIRFIPPDIKTFKVTEEQGGSKGIEIVDAILEQEVASAKAGHLGDINRSNYDFVFVAEQNFGAAPEYILHIVPKRKDKGLFLGDIWVDAKTYHIRQIVGVPAKSPSFWIKNLHITVQLAAVNGTWIPVFVHGIATVRFLGICTLTGRNLTPPIADSGAVGGMAVVPPFGGSVLAGLPAPRVPGFFAISASN